MLAMHWPSTCIEYVSGIKALVPVNAYIDYN